MARNILFKGNPLTLEGRFLKEKSLAPDFNVISTDLREKKFYDFNEKAKIITSFPSLDTPVCDLQVKEFNRKAVEFSDDVIVLGISKDLPFAQKRFCEANNINKVITLSDYKFSSFGINYGLLIKELNLLARSILIVDENNIIRYFQIVKELTSVPDYQDALNNLNQVLSEPGLVVSQEIQSKCRPCEGGIPALPKDKLNKLLAQYQGWELLDDKKLKKVFKFKDFSEAKYFLDIIAAIAEEQGHHPTATLLYNKVKITLTTHAVAGLTENDFIMAKIIDEVGE